MEVRSAEIARRREEREQRRKDKEMERVAQLQHKEEERREAERKAREALTAKRREERKVARDCWVTNAKATCTVHVAYSLDITTPSFIASLPPYYLYKFAAEVRLSPIYAPLSPCNSDEREEG